MSARELFPHVVDEVAELLGSPAEQGERGLRLFARWRVADRQGAERDFVVRWSPARPERVEVIGSSTARGIAATTEGALMEHVCRPELLTDGLRAVTT